MYLMGIGLVSKKHRLVELAGEALSIHIHTFCTRSGKTSDACALAICVRVGRRIVGDYPTP